MPKTDNVQSIRLYESICKHSDQATAERIAHKIPLSKSADFMKKFKWAESICTDLELEFDDDTVKQIRMDCACGPGADRINIVKEIYQSTVDINNFVTKINAKNFGFTLS